MPLTSSEETYIVDNYKSISVPDMAKQLGRGAATLYLYMKAKDLKPFVNKENNRGKADHPFRKQNKALEQYHIARKEKRA